MEMIYRKFLVIYLLVSWFVLNDLNGQSPSFKTFMNPVIPGDHPDATLTRVGKDFYTTGSSFNVTPIIYHSTDLVHWEAIAQPVSASWTNFGNTPGGGCWGGHMVYFKGKYWDFFSRAGSMYFVKADHPSGPWGAPVKVNNPTTLSYTLGYDNSIFIDYNDKWYLVVKNGQPNNAIVELSDDGQPTGMVYNLSWLNPAPSYPYSWAEGPVMWKSSGYYYYSFARDLSGGQQVMRSRELTADQASWELMDYFFNQNDPLKSGSLFTDPNHNSPAVMLDDSTYWVIHPLYAKGEWKGQGRQGLLNQVRYDANLKPTADYPVNKSFSAPDLPGSGIPWMVPKSDFFNTVRLNPEWCFLGYTPANTCSLTDRPGWLRLSPIGTRSNTIIKNDGEHNYSLITKLEFEATSANQEAGLRIIRGDETKYVKLFSSVNSSGQKLISFSFGTVRYDAPDTIGNIVWLKIIRINHSVSGYFSHNGIAWTRIGSSFDISIIDSYSDFTSFTGTRQGLYVQNNTAYFDFYIYRDAYTPIMAGWPANQSGTTQINAGSLDNIHNNDWALYAGVEFGNREYGKAADSVLIVASGVTGGQAEIWLDSIETGTRIGTCDISATGSWTTYHTFAAKVNQTTGRHDVYVKFTGSSAERLFQIKTLQFVAVHAPNYLSSYTSSDSTISVLLDRPVIAPQVPTGFKITLHDTESDSIIHAIVNPADSSEIILTLFKKVIYADKITISYDSGSIQIREGLELVAFNNKQVSNLLPDPAPRILSAETNFNGDSVMLQFSKKMKSPGTFANQFELNRNSTENISIDTAVLKTDDSATFVLRISPRVFYEDTLTLSYSGTEIVSSDEYPLKQFAFLPITDSSSGYPPQLLSTQIRKNDTIWNEIVMKFDITLDETGSQKDFFTIKINNQTVIIHAISRNYDSIQFTFSPSVKYGDEVRICYSGGTISSLHHGLLADINDYLIPNSVPFPVNTTDLNRNNAISIYPLPLKGRFEVNSGTGFNALQIYNLEGKLIFEKAYRFNTYADTVDVDLKKGVYIIRLVNQAFSTDLKVLAD
jgi:beta-xylosidase